jgi:hypothetical protein
MYGVMMGAKGQERKPKGEDDGVYYMHTYENSIMQLIKRCLKGGKKRKVETQWRDELVEGALYTCTELSQLISLILLIYAKLKNLDNGSCFHLISCNTV